VRITLREGTVPGKAAITLKAQGAMLALPSLTSVASPVTVQLRNPTVCWGASYGAPFGAQTPALLRDKSD
jgi:hypothetical protein